MKTIRASLFLLLCGCVLTAQDAAPNVTENPASVATLRSPEELEQLVAPISLYPDALIALILPASTVPADIVLAARYQRENPGARDQIEHRAWDESVKSLTSYAEVLNWMDENLQWTKQLGEAFLGQPADVMQAIQRLRAKARAAGTLVDTPQQQVIAEAEVIRIVPAQPDVIYVPHYEPQVVFYDPPVYYSRPYLSFGIGVPVGAWLAFDCDWRRNTIWVGNRHRRWTGHDWHRPVVPIATGPTAPRHPEVRPWRPPPQAVRPAFSVSPHARVGVAQPAPFSVSSSRSYSYTSPNSSGRRYDPATYPVQSTAPRPSRPFAPSVRPESREPITVTPATPPNLSAPATVVGPTPTVPPSTTVTVAPSNGSRRRGDGPRDSSDGRPRSSRSPTVTAASPPTVVTAPPSVPSLPAAVPPPAGAPVRAYTRSGPPPTVHRSPPPPAPASRPTVAPAPAPEAAAPQPAPASAPNQRSGGESRAPRGPGDRRGDPAR